MCLQRNGKDLVGTWIPIQQTYWEMASGHHQLSIAQVARSSAELRLTWRVLDQAELEVTGIHCEAPDGSRTIELSNGYSLSLLGNGCAARLVNPSDGTQFQKSLVPTATNRRVVSDGKKRKESDTGTGTRPGDEREYVETGNSSTGMLFRERGTVPPLPTVRGVTARATMTSPQRQPRGPTFVPSASAASRRDDERLASHRLERVLDIIARKTGCSLSPEDREYAAVRLRATTDCCVKSPTCGRGATVPTLVLL